MKLFEKKYLINVFFCLIYLLIILFITLFSRSNSLINNYKFDLLWPYIAWMNGNEQYGKQILLNIVLFIPFGFFLTDVFNNIGVSDKDSFSKRWIFPIGVSLVTTVLIETIQYIWGLGLCDIDDVFSNLLGAFIGILIYKLGEFLFVDSDRQWKLMLSFIFMLAGLVGCAMSGMSAQQQPSELIKQFDFDITNVELSRNSILLQGYCSAYNRKTPPYQIYLKGEVSGNVYKANTKYTERNFNTTVPVDCVEKFEVDVKFDGFSPMNTFTYINNKVEYVSGKIIDPETYGTDLGGIIEKGVLKAFAPDYEVYVYQVNNILYWLIGTPVDKRIEIIFNLQTNEPDKLPERRKKYKFDNLGFRPGGKNEITNSMRCGKYRVFERALPSEYNITAVTVGFNTGGEITWKRSFRVKRIEK